MPLSEVEIGRRIQYSTEVRPWAVDYTLEMDVGDALASATSTLTDLLTGAAYTAGLSGTPTVVGNVATQTVTTLLAGHSYRLVLLANMGGAKRTASSVVLDCPA